MRPSTLTVDAVATSDWYPLDHSMAPFNVSVGVSLDGGALTYDLEYTYVDVLRGDVPAADEVFKALTAQTAAGEHQFASPVAAVRLNVTAYTSGAAKATVLQAGY